MNRVRTAVTAWVGLARVSVLLHNGKQHTVSPPDSSALSSRGRMVNWSNNKGMHNTRTTPCILPGPNVSSLRSRLGLPFIDRPVHVETLASAAVEALFDSSVRGVQDWRGMEKLAESYKANKAPRGGAAGGTDGSMAEL